MICRKCGNEVKDGQLVCPNCGTHVAENNVFGSSQIDMQGRQEVSSARTMGIVSIITGILGVALIGWICGGIGLSIANRYLFSNNIQIRASAQEAKKLNKIGLIVSSVIFALALVFAIIMFAVTFGLVSTYSYF